MVSSGYVRCLLALCTAPLAAAVGLDFLVLVRPPPLVLLAGILACACSRDAGGALLSGDVLAPNNVASETGIGFDGLVLSWAACLLAVAAVSHAAFQCRFWIGAARARHPSARE